MKRFFAHPLVQMTLGWLFLFAVWMLLPADPPFVDQPTTTTHHERPA
ncbi:hypothetical protein [Burkholderia vietnamiensis]|nr:hypothetical protein [Burkholderia vietnamiensis]MBH9645081.1 hypothetical protein [Burkholderia vietnamiensis]